LNRQGLFLLLIAATAFSTLAIFMKVAFWRRGEFDHIAGVSVSVFSVTVFLHSDSDTQKPCTPVVPMVADFGFGRGGACTGIHFLRHFSAAFAGLAYRTDFYLYPAMVTGLAMLIGWEK